MQVHHALDFEPAGEQDVFGFGIWSVQWSGDGTEILAGGCAYFKKMLREGQQLKRAKWWQVGEPWSYGNNSSKGVKTVTPTHLQHVGLAGYL